MVVVSCGVLLSGCNPMDIVDRVIAPGMPIRHDDFEYTVRRVERMDRIGDRLNHLALAEEVRILNNQRSSLLIEQFHEPIEVRRCVLVADDGGVEVVAAQRPLPLLVGATPVAVRCSPSWLC